MSITFGKLQYGDRFYYVDDDVSLPLLKIDVPRFFGRRIPMAVYIKGGYAHFINNDQEVVPSETH